MPAPGRNLCSEPAVTWRQSLVSADVIRKHILVLVVVCIGLTVTAPRVLAMARVNHRADVCKRDLIAIGGLNQIMADPRAARPGNLGCTYRPSPSLAVDGSGHNLGRAARWDVVAALVGGHYQVAKSLALERVYSHPGDQWSLLVAGVAAQAAGNSREAFTYWRGLDNAEPSVLSMADRLAASGDLPQALTYYRAVAQAFPRSQDAHLKLAEALYGANLWREARQQYVVAFGLSGGHLVDLGRARYHQATILSAEGAHREAIAALRDAVARRPGYFPYADALGQEYATIGEDAIAERWFEAAVRMAPESGGVYWAYGKYFMQRGMFHSAVEKFKQAVRVEPKGPPYFYGDLGAADLSEGNTHGAISALTLAIERDPGNATYRQWLTSAQAKATER